MLKVFLCEDITIQLQQITQYVEDFIATGNYDMEVALATEHPDVLIDYLKKNKGTGIYFLNVDLNHEINGITLATIIREYDPRGFIIFITVRSEALPLTFKYKAEAMDFIVKDAYLDIRNRVEECLVSAWGKYNASAPEERHMFTLKGLGEMIRVDLSKVLYFEALGSNNKVAIHSEYGIDEIYGTLKEVEKSLGSNFFRCHRSYIVNVDHVKVVDRLNRFKIRVILNNGVNLPVSRGNSHILEKMMKKGN